MKRLGIFIILFVFLFLSLVFPHKRSNFSVFVTEIKGRGVISDPLNGKNVIVKNLPITAGDLISIKENGYLELTDSDGNVLRAGGSDTKIKFKSVDEKKVEIELKKGEVFLNKCSNMLYAIKSGNLLVASKGGSRFLFQKLKGEKNIYCFVGPVNIKMGNQKKVIYEPESAEVYDEKIEVLKSSEYKRDGLYLWGEKRDREFNNLISKKFIPFKDINPVVLYELSHYGKWIKHPKWGYVWVPNKIPSDWHPYSYGKWYGVGRDTNLVWISAEPWGILYYCGDWAFDSKYGWVLVLTRIKRPVLNDSENLCWFFQGEYVYWAWGGFLNTYGFKKIPKKYVSGMRVGDFLGEKLLNKRRLLDALRNYRSVKLSPSKIYFNKRRLFRKIYQMGLYRNMGNFSAGGFSSFRSSGGRGMVHTGNRGFSFHGSGGISPGGGKSPRRK